MHSPLNEIEPSVAATRTTAQPFVNAMFFRRERILPREKTFLSLTAWAFQARFPHVIIEDNLDAADLIRAHPKCPRQTFVWSGEFTVMDERQDPTTYCIAADGPIQVPTTHVVVMEK